MTPTDWLTWSLSILLAVFGTWLVSSRHAKRVERELSDTRTKLDSVLNFSKETHTAVDRIEQGEAVRTLGADQLRPTIELAVTSLLGLIIREAGNSANAKEVMTLFQEASPKLAAQWQAVTPMEEERLRLISELQSMWKDTFASRSWGGGHSRDGGVQLGPKLYIPANVVMGIQNMNPLSFEARLAERHWYRPLRLALLEVAIAAAIIELFIWPYLPSSVILLVGFAWFVLLCVTITLYTFESRRKEEKLRRPEWSVLFPPGALADEPCHVEFGLESRTLIARLPLSAWVPRTLDVTETKP